MKQQEKKTRILKQKLILLIFVDSSIASVENL